MGNWGAGLTTADSPMLMSLSLRIAPETLGAGATIAACAVTVAFPRLEEIRNFRRGSHGGSLQRSRSACRWQGSIRRWSHQPGFSRWDSPL